MNPEEMKRANECIDMANQLYPQVFSVYNAQYQQTQHVLSTSFKFQRVLRRMKDPENKAAMVRRKASEIALLKTICLSMAHVHKSLQESRDPTHFPIHQDLPEVPEDLLASLISLEET